MTARLRHFRHRDLKGLERDRLDQMKEDLKSGVPPNRLVEHVFTADNLTDVITVPGQNTLAVVGNASVAFICPRVIVVGTLPTGLEYGTLYWLGKEAGANEYKLYPTKKDAAKLVPTNPVTFTTNGSGTLTMIMM